LRDRLLTLRRQLSPADIASRSQAVCARLAAENAYISARRIGAYYPFLGEVDVLPQLAAAQAEGREVYLPRLMDGGSLSFARWSGEPLEKGPRGVLQPAAGGAVAELAELDLVIVPGLAFDRARQRLGLGAGFYDRTLGAAPRRPHTIGVAYNFQLVEEVPADAWDVPLDVVVAESSRL
jgi:5-formyltetrahydrofolate cyclo-ligase